MLLARMAEAVYWAGRYLERAEDTARIVQVHGETHIDLPVGEDVGWVPLVEIAGTRSEYQEHISRAGPRTPTVESKGSVEAQVVAFVLTDRDNPSSILASIAAARDNLRTRPARGPARGVGAVQRAVADGELGLERHRRRATGASGGSTA